uniref:Uncharacterized protein n=1 Tax=Chenopodium quinoa TaxID=63459 RepID=A0A803NCQ0_CHEQI
MLNESVAFSLVLSHSCPPRRATRSLVLSHKISTPPACWPGESKFSSGQLSTQSSAKNTVESRNARCWCAYCPRGKKEERQGSVQIWLFAVWEQITQKIPGNNEKKNRLEVRGPLVLYPTPEPAAFAPSKTALVPFLSPFCLLLCFVPKESKAKLKCPVATKTDFELVLPKVSQMSFSGSRFLIASQSQFRSGKQPRNGSMVTYDDFKKT